MPNYDQNLDAAPKNRNLLLLVPSGNIEAPYAIEIGWWDRHKRRWEGDWRYDTSKGNWAKADPIAWADVPDIDEEFLDFFRPSIKLREGKRSKTSKPAQKPSSLRPG